MAESVDALVSNTSGVTSIPVRPRVWVRGKAKLLSFQSLGFFSFYQLKLNLEAFRNGCLWLFVYLSSSFVGDVG